MPRFYLTFIFLCVIFIINAENTEHFSIERADSFLIKGNYLDCIIECEKILYYSKSADLHRDALIIKGEALKIQGEYHKAAESFNQIRILSPDDSLFHLKIYELALCQYLAGDHNNVLTTITKWEQYNNKKNLPADILLVKVLAQNSLFQFSEAYQELSEWLQQNNYASREFERLYKKRSCPKKKNPEHAKNMSMIIPGLGQFYSSRCIEGGISFILNAGALTFGVYHIYLGYYFTGYVTGFTLLHKFHSGGMRRSEVLAKTKNEKNIIEFNKKFINIWKETIFLD